MHVSFDIGWWIWPVILELIGIGLWGYFLKRPTAGSSTADAILNGLFDGALAYGSLIAGTIGAICLIAGHYI